MNAQKIEEKVMTLIKEKGVQAALELIKKDFNQFITLPSLEEMEKAIYIENNGNYSEEALRMLYEREKSTVMGKAIHTAFTENLKHPMPLQGELATRVNELIQQSSAGQVPDPTNHLLKSILFVPFS